MDRICFHPDVRVELKGLSPSDVLVYEDYLDEDGDVLGQESNGIHGHHFLNGGNDYFIIKNGLHSSSFDVPPTIRIRLTFKGETRELLLVGEHLVNGKEPAPVVKVVKIEID